MADHDVDDQFLYNLGDGEGNGASWVEEGKGHWGFVTGTSALLQRAVLSSEVERGLRPIFSPQMCNT